MPNFKHKSALKVKICTFSQKMTTVDAKNIPNITPVVRKPWLSLVIEGTDAILQHPCIFRF